MDQGSRRTTHFMLPATGRPLCGYEEEDSTSGQRSTAVACPECVALLRSGLMARAPSMRA